MSVQALLDAGSLTEAISVATADVKNDPLRSELRAVLAELMCLVGNFERAETLIDAATKFYQKPAPGFVLLRHLVKGEMVRRQCFLEGVSPPEGAASEASKHAAQVLQDLRQGRPEEAAARMAREMERCPLNATVKLTSGESCTGSDFRDLNDLTANVAELISMAGKYYWQPWNEIGQVRFRPVNSLRDLLWRPVDIVRTDGQVDQVFMPSLYEGTSRATDDATRLGRETNWHDLGGGLMSGCGLRMFLAGEATPSVLEITDIHLTLGDKVDVGR